MTSEWMPPGFEPQQRNRDQLSIDTPEHVALDFPLAGVGSRVLAHLVDLSIQIGFYIAMVFVFALLWRPLDRAMGRLSDHGQMWVVGGFILINFLLWWAYFTCFEAFWKGQTPGKRAMKLRVLKDTGRQITFFEALTRNLLRLVDSLFGYAVGLVTMLISRENKRIGDLLAGTIVVHTDAERTAASFAPAGRGITAGLYPVPVYAEAAPEESLFPQTAIARLSSNDLMLVESFAARTTELDHDTSERLASQILTRLCGTMQVQPPAGISARRALDNIGRTLRRTLAASRTWPRTQES